LDRKVRVEVKVQEEQQVVSVIQYKDLQDQQGHLLREIWDRLVIIAKVLVVI
jgi:hypothetical protein